MSTSRARVEVVNPYGLHLRAAQRFVRVAERYRSEVIVARDGRSADGRSILDLLLLAAGPGSTLDLGADGPDSDEAIAALSALIESGFEGGDIASAGGGVFAT